MQVIVKSNVKTVSLGKVARKGELGEMARKGEGA